MLEEHNLPVFLFGNDSFSTIGLVIKDNEEELIKRFKGRIIARKTTKSKISKCRN